MTPFKLTAAYKDYLWGGERLKTDYHMQTDCTPLAESWCLSCHPDGESVVAAGPHGGETLSALLGGEEAQALLGKNGARFPYFPLLIKFIDAAKPLSIQVHPSDAYALEHEDSYGKTEMWYILDAEPDSFLYYGVQRPVTTDEMREAIRAGTLEELMARRPVKAGDVVFIPAGMMHAIGAGIVLCEVQQNSNLTYRVYDYGRRGADGALRPLHVEKALKVADLTPATGSFSPQGQPVTIDGAVETLLCSCDKFVVRSLVMNAADAAWHGEAVGDTFLSLVCTEGEGEVCCGGETLPFQKGESLFIPANAGKYRVRGHCTCVLSSIPE